MSILNHAYEQAKRIFLFYKYINIFCFNVER